MEPNQREHFSGFEMNLDTFLFIENRMHKFDSIYPIENPTQTCEKIPNCDASSTIISNLKYEKFSTVNYSNKRFEISSND